MNIITSPGITSDPPPESPQHEDCSVDVQVASYLTAAYDISSVTSTIRWWLTDHRAHDLPSALKQFTEQLNLFCTDTELFYLDWSSMSVLYTAPHSHAHSHSDVLRCS